MMEKTAAVQASLPNLAVRLLYDLLLLLAVGAMASGALLMISPDGGIMHMPLSMIQGSPFACFFIPGLILFTFLGVFPALVAYGLRMTPGWGWAEWFNPFKVYHWSWVGSLVAGVIVLSWLSIELLWIGFSFLHALYYAWGGVIIILALLPVVRKTFRQ